MRGYVVEKGGRFYAVIYEGRDPITGRERRSWHPARTDRAAAERSAVLPRRLPRRRTAPEASRSRDTSWTPGYLESRSAFDRAPGTATNATSSVTSSRGSGASRSAASGATTSIPSTPNSWPTGTSTARAASTPRPSSRYTSSCVKPSRTLAVKDLSFATSWRMTAETQLRGCCLRVRSIVSPAEVQRWRHSYHMEQQAIRHPAAGNP